MDEKTDSEILSEEEAVERVQIGALSTIRRGVLHDWLRTKDYEYSIIHESITTLDGDGNPSSFYKLSLRSNLGFGYVPHVTLFDLKRAKRLLPFLVDQLGFSLIGTIDYTIKGGFPFYSLFKMPTKLHQASSFSTDTSLIYFNLLFCILFENYRIYWGTYKVGKDGFCDNRMERCRYEKYLRYVEEFIEFFEERLHVSFSLSSYVVRQYQALPHERNISCPKRRICYIEAATIPCCFEETYAFPIPDDSASLENWK